MFINYYVSLNAMDTMALGYKDHDNVDGKCFNYTYMYVQVVFQCFSLSLLKKC